MIDVVKKTQNLQRITYTVPAYLVRNMVVAALAEDVGSVFNQDTICSLQSDGSMTVSTDYPQREKP